jgi:hypothetical protein
MSILTGKLIHKPIVVTIRGNVSTGKSPWARELEKKAKAAGCQVVVSDCDVFAFSKSYEKDYEATRDWITAIGADIGVIVVGTGNGKDAPFSIDIEPAITAPMDILALLCNWPIPAPHKDEAAV